MGENLPALVDYQTRLSIDKIGKRTIVRLASSVFEFCNYVFFV